MNLSDEIQELVFHSNYIDGQCGLFKDKFIHHNHVKQFIKELKDPESPTNPTDFCEVTGVFRLSDWWKKIDERAGEGLL